MLMQAVSKRLLQLSSWLWLLLDIRPEWLRISFLRAIRKCINGLAPDRISNSNHNQASNTCSVQMHKATLWSVIFFSQNLTNMECLTIWIQNTIIIFNTLVISVTIAWTTTKMKMSFEWIQWSYTCTAHTHAHAHTWKVNLIYPFVSLVVLPWIYEPN